MNARSKVVNDEVIHALVSSFHIGHSNFIIHSSLVIRI
jgi:hypothetical protein